MDDRLLVYAIAFWDPRDIARSAAVSSTMYGIIQHHRHLVWDPDTHFQPWFRAPAETFRGMLRICGAIVTGSQILQFFNRTSYPDSDMDIFMRVGGLWYMGGWLRSQGYTFAAVSSDYRLFRRQVMRLCSRMMTDHPAHNPAIRGVYNFHRYVASQTVVHLQKIQLIAVDMDPVHHVIFDFHSTAVMNYMTSDTVISVFPLSTFVFQKSYVAKMGCDSPTTTLAWRAKYRDRGFNIIRKRSRGAHSDLKPGKRSAADHRCWKIKLNAPRNATGRTLENVYGPVFTDVPFDVMHWRSGVTYGDSFTRLSEPGIWRCLSKLRKNYPGLLKEE